MPKEYVCSKVDRPQSLYYSFLRLWISQPSWTPKISHFLSFENLFEKWMIFTPVKPGSTNRLNFHIKLSSPQVWRRAALLLFHFPFDLLFTPPLHLFNFWRHPCCYFKEEDEERKKEVVIEWMNKRTNKQMNKWTKEQTNKQTLTLINIDITCGLTYLNSCFVRIPGERR